MSNAGPGNYESHLKDKKKEPSYTIGARPTVIDKKINPSPADYNIPSKIVEKPGKSMG